MKKLVGSEKREYQEYVELCQRIRQGTQVHIPRENEVQKRKRVEALKQDFVAFCRYYFPVFMDADFAWFHKKAAKSIIDDPNVFAILEWPREHAKSVFSNIMVPLFLYARGELTGMVVASANEDKAVALLSDIQAQLDSNALWINDYGELAKFGDWQNGYFSTIEGIGFWAFGRSQSPRGIRKAAKRPNYAVVDDIDDKVIVKNSERVDEAVGWVLEDLYGSLSILGARLVIAGNRIHAKSILAHLVGDVEPGDPKREGIVHIKVFALENPKTHKEDATTGQPAWKERYTRDIIVSKMKKMGYRAAMREFFHKHIENGKVFKPEWIQYNNPGNLDSYDEIVVYGDPSFKNTKGSDFKAIVACGRKGHHITVLRAWVMQASINSMVETFYDFYDQFGDRARYYIEANMLQDLLFSDEFITVGDKRGKQLPIRQDKRKKPDKYTRIENMSPLFERGMIDFSERVRKNNGLQTLIAQILAFPTGHDDGPDALEGSVSLMSRSARSSNFKPRMGKYNRNTKRA